MDKGDIMLFLASSLWLLCTALTIVGLGLKSFTPDRPDNAATRLLGYSGMAFVLSLVPYTFHWIGLLFHEFQQCPNPLSALPFVFMWGLIHWVGTVGLAGGFFGLLALKETGSHQV